MFTVLRTLQKKCAFAVYPKFTAVFTGIHHCLYICDRMLKSLAAQCAEKEKILQSAASAGTGGYVYSSDILNADDLLKLGFSVINEIPGLFLIMRQPESHTCLLLSSSEQRRCGTIVKENVKRFSGKGGGRDDNARAIFPSAADMDAFIREISSQN